MRNRFSESWPAVYLFIIIRLVGTLVRSTPHYDPLEAEPGIQKNIYKQYIALHPGANIIKFSRIQAQFKSKIVPD